MTLRTTQMNEEPEDNDKEEDSLDIEGWSIDGISEKFRQWLEHNQRKFLVDFEHPRVDVDQDEDSFNLRFHDTYNFRIELEKQRGSDV